MASRKNEMFPRENHYNDSIASYTTEIAPCITKLPMKGSDTPFKFLIKSIKGEFIDPRNIVMYLKFKVWRKGNREELNKIEAAENVTPYSGFFYTMFKVTLLWLHRHIWKHLSDDFGLSPFRCTVEGCEYSTYLRRSLDSHCNYHMPGSTTEQLGLIDERKKYTNEYMQCMVDCFGPNAHEVVSDSSFHESSTVNGSVERIEQNRAVEMQKHQSPVLDFNSFITAVPTDVWCQLCQCGFDGAEADEHVWQAHLGGVQPFRCGRCQKSFLELTQMEHHWRSEHNFHHTDEIEVIEYPEALSHFENTLVECFPDLAARRRTIKIEQID